MFVIEPPKRRRRPDLTPMIDVVFLLLVFFMLASRFSTEQALPLLTAGQSESQWQGPLRLIDIGTGAAVELNGAPMPMADVIAQLGSLMQSPDDPIALRGREATTQDIVTIMEQLRGAGFQRLVLVE
ncbi:biopolymer transporter ExbD [Falsirhodobacter sp. alg1]|uniref:ExbD/TolR family protein n=1 Tax=Falsirhodobacter sp. alg1 TaxID=1472418 RepID=UPI0005F07E10|nr:biopolymer transporter ExbD [Falsirhodobacter sp. alg1]